MKIDVLDKGYVRLVDHMGSDLEVVNDARVSFEKESEEFGPADEKLLNFLIREGHTSPFRGSVLKFEVYAPFMVARQWWKYAVSSSHRDDQLGWNESSRRYVTEEPTFYLPHDDEWRSAPANKKQGSGDFVHISIGTWLTADLANYIEKGVQLYEDALADGIAPEQARLFLPAYGMYVRWRWTASLSSVLFFLKERLEHDAQLEIQMYAKAIRDLTEQCFPMSVGAINEG